MKEDIKQALRMIGHLLEHHPTTGDSSRNRRGDFVPITSSEASCWCLVGAKDVVAYRTGLYDQGRSHEIYVILRNVLCSNGLVEIWEGPGTSDQTRLEIAKKLQGV